MIIEPVAMEKTCARENAIYIACAAGMSALIMPLRDAFVAAKALMIALIPTFTRPRLRERRMIQHEVYDPNGRLLIKTEHEDEELVITWKARSSPMKGEGALFAKLPLERTSEEGVTPVKWKAPPWAERVLKTTSYGKR